MNIKAAIIVILIFGTAIITATYHCRGYWAVGSEWVLPMIVGMLIPLKENGRRNEKRPISKLQLRGRNIKQSPKV